jgi:yersiniabactin nonribosomal peptide synthetase
MLLDDTHLTTDIIDQHTAPYTSDDDANLIKAGMNSLAVMRLANLLRRSGARAVTFSKLMARPTRSAWRGFVSGTIPAPTSAPVQKPAASTTRNDSKPFELTDIQRAYFMGRQDGMPLGGNGCHAYLELHGSNVDPQRLQTAWRMLFDAHPMLRARFTEDSKQYVSPQPATCATELIIHDLSAFEPKDADEHFLAIREKLSHRRLDVTAGQTCGLALALLPGGKTRVSFDIDLLVCDVQSFQILLRDLAIAYADGTEPAADPEWDFASYIAYEADKATADSDGHKQDALYWRERIADIPQGPQLPTVIKPDSVFRPRYANYAHQINSATYASLKAHAAVRGETVAMVLLAAYAQILAAWSENPRFLVNMPIFARDTSIPGIEDVVTDFSDILLLEVDFSFPTTFEERLEQISTRFLADMEHRSYSGMAIQRDVAAAGGPQTGLAALVFACNLGDQLLTRTCIENFGELGFMTSQTPQVQIDCQVFDHEDGLRISWDAADELYPVGMCQAMFAAFCNLIENLAASDSTWVSVIDVMPDEQRTRRNAELATLRETSADSAPLHSAFMDCVCKDPESVAFIDAQTGDTSSYVQMYLHAGAIAQMLVDAGIQRNELVAVCLERGKSQVCALLGIVMAGCTYVPIDAAQPQARKRLMADKLKARYVLTSRALKAENTMFNRVIAIEDVPTEVFIPQVNELVEKRMPHPDDTAYIIMTSGSTGTPKGVEMSHGAAWNTISDVSARLGVGMGDRMLGVSNYDFDLSVYDVFGILGAGATLVGMPDDARRDAARGLGFVLRYGVTLWNTVPMLLDMLITEAESVGAALPLRAVMLSGDWVGMDLPQRLENCASGCRFIAMGGATEAAVWSNWQEVFLPIPANWASIPYGRPLRAQCYRVVDTCGQDRPDWAIGELLIGGAGVAKGYRGDKELTGEHFIEDGGIRWYCTGDMGRFWDDGTIEFFGRRDFQVKVKGHRIELGEIEAAIVDFPDVSACAVCVAPPTSHLVALVQPNPNADLNLNALLEFVAKRVPSYMVPTRFAAIDALPLSANGKIDRKAIGVLAQQTVAALKPDDDQPQSHTEIKLARIWEETLGVDSIGRNDSYYELGGNSLTATRIIGIVRDWLGINLTTADVFTHTTIANLARLVDERIAAKDVEKDSSVRDIASGVSTRTGIEGLPEFIVHTDDPGTPFALTALQRAYLVGRQEGMILGGQATRAYSEVTVRDLDMSRLSIAMTALVKAQGALRLSVDEADITQVINESVPPVVIPLADVSYLDESAWDKFLQSKRDELFERKFALSRPFLWAMEVTRWNDEWHIHFCHDGIIMDGWSSERMFDELEALYHGGSLNMDISYRDYALWLEQVQGCEAYARDEAYWLEKARGFPDSQALETVCAPDAIAQPATAHVTRRIPKHRWDAIKLAAASRGMTVFAVMLCAFGKALELNGGCHDFLINTPLAYRPQISSQIDNLMGECSDYRLFHFSTEPEDTLARTARKVFSQLTDEGLHTAYRGTNLSRALQQRFGGSAIAPIVFTSTAEVNLKGSDWYRKISSRTHTSQVWMDAVVMPIAEGFLLNIDYVENLLVPGTVQRVADSFVHALDLLVDQPDSWDVLTRLPISAEDQTVINRMNDTDAPGVVSSYGPLLRAAFAAYSDKTAIVGSDLSLSYRELEQLTGRLSAAIETKTAEVGADIRARVGIATGKGAKQVAAALACAASGHPFMPIDIEYPAQTIHGCYEDARLAFILVDQQTLSGIPKEIPMLDVDIALPEQGEITWRDASGTDTIAIINTSGSTGAPKSIQLTNEGVVNCLLWSKNAFGIDESSRVLAITNFAHDMALYDTLGPLLTGAALVTLNEETRREPRAWIKALEAHNVTFWNSVPALMRIMLETGGTIGEDARASLRCVVHGGDWLDPGLARSIMKTFPNARLFNVGGPTETTIWNIAHEVTPDDIDHGEIPYGRPIQNTRYFVLDDRMDPCPVGVSGIMYVAGIGVSTGYLNADREAQVFKEWNGMRVCCTGDRGMCLPSSELRILGRADLQVKVNGKRIEIGGIERLVNQVDGISACAVVLNTGAGRLVAYFTGDSRTTEDAIRSELLRQLPAYMVPTRFIALDSIPLTRNGKPDRESLAKYDLPGHATDSGLPASTAAQLSLSAEDAPASEGQLDNRFELTLSEIVEFCRDVIGDKTIGPDDNFFAVGGDSLTAMKIGAWAHDHFGHELSVVQIMAQPTVREWAEILCD